MIYIGSETQHAKENFSFSDEKLDNHLIRAMAMVKLASCKTNMDLGYLPEDIANAISGVCSEFIDGKHFDTIVVDPYQGGAGTSTNMNFNEIIAHLASDKPNNMNVDPLNHVNLHQSTNDVFPTAVKNCSTALSERT